jgi:hypothetical protein
MDLVALRPREVRHRFTALTIALGSIWVADLGCVVDLDPASRRRRLFCS